MRVSRLRAVVAGLLIAIYFGSRPPNGVAEELMWSEIKYDERLGGTADDPVTLIEWTRGAHIGDQAPTDRVLVASPKGTFWVEVTSWCTVPDGWHASIVSVDAVQDGG